MSIAMVPLKYRYAGSLFAILMAAACSIGCAVDSGTATEYAGLVNSLRQAGVTVEPRGEVASHFLSAELRLVAVNDSDVLVWEYEDATAAETEAAGISPDGFALRTLAQGTQRIIAIEWVGPPHFYKTGKLVVLYVGESEVVIDALESVLGPQFAGL